MRPEANARQRDAPSGAKVFGISFWRLAPGHTIRLAVIPREGGVSSTPQLLGSSELLWDTGSPAFAGDDNGTDRSSSACKEQDRGQRHCSTICRKSLVGYSIG